MEIREIITREIWDGFVTSLPDFTFLQSYSSGEFNEKMGNKIWRMGLFDDEELLGVCLAFKIAARRGSFIFVPHGPLIKNFSKETLTFFINKLKEIAIQEHAGFLRISPWFLKTKENEEMFAGFGLRGAPTFMHTEDTWLLDITKTEEELLSGMRKTTRNLIRQAEKKQVEIVKSKNISELAQLLELQKETAKRHKFVPFSKKYLETEFQEFLRNDECLLFLGRHGGETLSAAIIIFYGERAFYFQSASINTSVPVSYLLQWEVIREARARGCKEYNFWGIAPHDKPNHPWVGLTLFKTGFGGFEKNYMHASDLVLSPFYWLTYFVEKIPRTWREKLLYNKSV